ncbi:triacylglycerol lipase V [Fusarium bulbicola]|nr:triacylglycerol lipase V [Fusarium bulbicola]
MSTGGKMAGVPVLMWTVAEEGRGLINRNISLETLFGAYISTTRQQRQILDAYPGLKTEFDTAAAIYTDVVWQRVSSHAPGFNANTSSPKLFSPTFQLPSVQYGDSASMPQPQVS